MRKHCSNVCKLRPCLDNESKNSARIRNHRDRSALVAIFVNGTYFLGNLCTFPVTHPLGHVCFKYFVHT
jgi:hypothetical protein